MMEWEILVLTGLGTELVILVGLLLATPYVSTTDI